ncbi:hypothetical protein CVT26_007934 [Gymnopilus dilepis]|uniref:Origin recognition complex subunit 2 n=1 Tax=Gymnopilus dilepis TaxID=231916 RepID=A0A409W7Q4_9AGAR|nr:hypothetical protein CVT26_007934 [Gymnopilus dilepis]
MPRPASTYTHEPEPTSEEEDIEDVDESDDSESEDLPNDATPSSRQKGKAKATYLSEESKIIVQTAFDAYFTYNKPGRAQTSSNVYSQLVVPLSAEEYADAIASSSKGVPSLEPSILRNSNLKSVFSRLMCELDEGFNIICYGLGSKRRVMNQLATSECSNRGHVVIANGFQPNFTIKDLLNSIESIPPIQDLDLPSAPVEKQTRRIHDFFAVPSQETHLYLVIHNIDAAPLRSNKAKSLLAILAHNPRIHIIASIDHINAPLLWSSSEIFSRKPSGAAIHTTPSRGFAWLWHDLTTLASYDFELTFADRSSLSGAHTGGARRKADALNAQNTATMSETAASHILASVAQKAQKLFRLLATHQLSAIESGDNNASNDLQQFGLGYDVLFDEARANFIAANETALRQLLGEFRDHNLIVSSQDSTGGGEILWIPMRKERLANVLESLAPL